MSIQVVDCLIDRMSSGKVPVTRTFTLVIFYNCWSPRYFLIFRNIYSLNITVNWGKFWNISNRLVRNRMVHDRGKTRTESSATDAVTEQWLCTRHWSHVTVTSLHVGHQCFLGRFPWKKNPLSVGIIKLLTIQSCGSKSSLVAKGVEVSLVALETLPATPDREEP